MWILRSLGAEADEALIFRLRPGHIKTAGRSPRADFIMDAPLVSRLHCRFEVGDDGGVTVQDLESTNGTYVDGGKVQRAVLADGAVVGVGRVQLRLERDTQA